MLGLQELGYGDRGATDQVRRAEVTRAIKLDTVEEAFTSKNWIVRIYKVKNLDNLGRNMTLAARYDSNDKDAETLRRDQQKRVGRRRSQLVA